MDGMLSVAYDGGGGLSFLEVPPVTMVFRSRCFRLREMAERSFEVEIEASRVREMEDKVRGAERGGDGEASGCPW